VKLPVRAGRQWSAIPAERRVTILPLDGSQFPL